MNYRLRPYIAALALVTLSLGSAAWAEGVPQPPPDPALVAAQTQMELGKALFEGGAAKAQVAQLTKQLAEAQGKIATLEKAAKEPKAGDAAPPPAAPKPPDRPQRPPQKP